MKIIEKIQALQIAAMLSFYSFLEDERGDTNFISIIVILAIALVVAGVFIGFKDAIIGKAQEIIDSFTIS